MELANYNFESGSKVRLFYKDGRQKLVSRSELTQHLAPLEAEQVQNAFHLRQAYFRELPKWVKVLMVSVLALGLGYQGVKAAPSIQRVLHTIVPAIPAPAEPTAQSAKPSAVRTAPEVDTSQSATQHEQQRPAEISLPAPAVENIERVVDRLSGRSSRRPAVSASPSARALIPGPVRLLQNQAHQ